MADGRVLGVDACRTGWVAICLSRDAPPVPYFASGIDKLVTVAGRDGAIEVVAIDMPIGLPDSGPREADLLARKAIGPRRSSVFMTPIRDALLADTHAEAVEINRRLAGMGVSTQAFAIRAKVLEVDRWVRRTKHRVIEAHPEMCFTHLAERHLPHPKSTWAGVEERRALLAGAGITLTGDLGDAGAAARVDDILDAAVTAWTARRAANNKARSLPNPPQIFSDALASAVWF